jgi:aminodeoxyfutalosine deaminase
LDKKLRFLSKLKHGYGHHRCVTHFKGIPLFIFNCATWERRKITFYQITMQYRKIKGNNIFDGHQFVGADKVLVTQASGVIEAIIDEVEAGEDVQPFDGIICPGFVNAHCHIELSHLKNAIPQHTGLVNFILAILKLRTAEDEIKQAAMRLAADELYNSGTIAVGDICNTTDSIALKQNSKIYWHNFIEVSGFSENIAQKRFDEIKEVYKQFSNQLQTSKNTDFQVPPPIGGEFRGAFPSGGFRGALSPHAPYSLSKTLFNFINQTALGKTLSIHNQETPTENEFLQNKTGDFLRLYETLGIDISSFTPNAKSSFQHWLPLLSNAKKIISVHNSFTCEADILFAKQFAPLQEIYFCLCPNANLYIENTLPPVEMLLKNNCNIVLGTDSYASNTQLNIFEEIKTIQKNFPQISLENILQWATINGARALEIDDMYGSFEKGKMSGVVLINDNSSQRIS